MLGSTTARVHARVGTHAEGVPMFIVDDTPRDRPGGVRQVNLTRRRQSRLLVGFSTCLTRSVLNVINNNLQLSLN